MPFQRFSQIYWYLLVGIPLFLAALYTAHIIHINRKILGLTWRKLPLQLLIGLIGIGLGYLEYLILSPTPMISELRLELVWLPALILLIFTGSLEEFIFRGLLQYTSGRRLGRYGMLYTAVVFTVLHLGYRSLLDLAFVFIVALFFSWLVQRSGSIVGVSLAHGLINISLYLIFPFL
jgi:membrane protease YdiL (CAAX protease family)